MPNVKCVVTYSVRSIEEVSQFKIEFEEAEKSINPPGTLTAKRDNINLNGGLHVFGVLHGTEGADCKMDVYINNNKINIEPIRSVYDDGGHYVLSFDLK